MFRLGRMDPKETAALIDAAGGPIEFARLLGIDGDEFVSQRVSNWKRRGLPTAIALEHYDLIQRLRAVSADSRVA